MTAKFATLGGKAVESCLIALSIIPIKIMILHKDIELIILIEVKLNFLVFRIVVTWIFENFLSFCWLIRRCWNNCFKFLIKHFSLIFLTFHFGFNQEKDSFKIIISLLMRCLFQKDLIKFMVVNFQVP